MIHILKNLNSNVTDFYLDVVGKMFEQNTNEKYEFLNMTDICKCNKNDIIVVSIVLDFVKLYFKGFRNIVFWVQGLEPEESYLKHGSKFKCHMLNILSKFAMKHAVGVIFVSDYMLNFIEHKFNISLKEKAFVMPCFNDVINKSAFYEDNKYSQNTFCYVGSLSKWQYFEQTLKFYMKLETLLDNTKLFVYTPEKEKATNILEKLGIKNYQVDFVSVTELNSRLKKVKFGFILREDIDVNRVATPTKLSSYLSAGVIPIYSACLKDFNEISESMKYTVPVYNISEIPCHLIELCKRDINCEDIYNEYIEIFKTYYSVEHYVQQSKNWILNIMNCLK